VAYPGVTTEELAAYTTTATVVFMVHCTQPAKSPALAIPKSSLLVLG